MIKAIIEEHGKKIVAINYKFLTVKDIHEDMRSRFGRPLQNQHFVCGNEVIVKWQFPKAEVQLQGANLHMGYRTKKG